MKQTGFNKAFNALEYEISGKVKEANQIAAAMASTGARITENLTRTRPSKKSGKRGRVETGDMAGDISFSVKEGETVTVAEFGWLGTVNPYYIFQTDSGFIHNMSGEFIEPTFALRDATEHVDNVIKDWISSGGKSK